MARVAPGDADMQGADEAHDSEANGKRSLLAKITGETKRTSAHLQAEMQRLTSLGKLKNADTPPSGIFNKVHAGFACFYPELPWGSPPAWKESGNPTTTWLVSWEGLTGLACIWVGVSLPYASFIDGAKDSEHQLFGGCAVEKWSAFPSLSVINSTPNLDELLTHTRCEPTHTQNPHTQIHTHITNLSHDLDIRGATFATLLI